MRLEPIYLCSWSGLGILLAGVVQNDVRREDLCWIFVTVGK
jgi:hypothetical protein